MGNSSEICANCKLWTVLPAAIRAEQNDHELEPISEEQAKLLVLGTRGCKVSGSSRGRARCVSLSGEFDQSVQP